MCLLAICLIIGLEFLLDSTRLFKFFIKGTLNPNTWLLYPLLFPILFFFAFAPSCSFFFLSWRIVDTIFIFYLAFLLALYFLSVCEIAYVDLSSFSLAQTVGGRSRGEVEGEKAWKKKALPIPMWYSCWVLFLFLLLYLVYLWSMLFKKGHEELPSRNKRY